MAYIGQKSSGTTAQSRTMDTMTGDGSTNTLTLSQTPDSAMDVAVYYDGVMQRPGVEYTLSGNTITFTTAPESGVVVYAMTGGAEDIGSPMAGSVTPEMIIDGAVTNAHIQSMSSNKLTGALPALDGSNLTGLPSTIDTKSANDPAIDTNPSAVGHLWANTTSGEMFVCTDNTAGENVWYNIGGGSGDVPDPKNLGNRGLFAGRSAPIANIIDYIAIPTTGNATDFGDMSEAIHGSSACSNGTRSFIFGGSDSSGNTAVNNIEYVTVSTPGNSTDFGDLLQANFAPGAVSDGTRGVVAGGYINNSTHINQIQYVTLSTTGNAIDFGDATLVRNKMGRHASLTRGVWAGGWTGSSPSKTNVIDYVTLATTGNAIDFGDRTVSTSELGSMGNGVRFLMCGGVVGPGSVTNVIDYVDIATTGNATNFGNLSGTQYDGDGCGNDTRGVYAIALCWSCGTVRVNTLDYYTFATPSNSTDFGDLTAVGDNMTGSSGD